MTYATRQDLETRFGADEVAGLDTAADGSTIQAALDDATARIDTMISSRYRLPLPSVPKILTAIACDVARMRLYDESPPDVVTEAGRNALTTLRAIRDGKIQLVADGRPLPAIVSAAGGASTRQVFTDKGFEGF